MSEIVRFKIDENLPTESCSAFRDAGYDAVSVLDQEMGGRTDADIAALCKSETRILVTLDTDFANILAYPPSKSPGIVVIRTADQAKPVVMRCVRKITAALAVESPQGRLWIVDSHHIRVRDP